MMLQDIADHLQGYGVGTQGTDLFYGSLPDAPDAAVCIYEYAGSPPEYVFEGLAYENPGLQAVARAATYVAARAKIQVVMDALTAKGSVVLNGTQYGLIGPRQSPFPLGSDAQGRPILACNFDVIKA